MIWGTVTCDKSLLEPMLITLVELEMASVWVEWGGETLHSGK